MPCKGSCATRFYPYATAGCLEFVEFVEMLCLSPTIKLLQLKSDLKDQAICRATALHLVHVLPCSI